jgi:hypothetical protein
MMAEHNILTEWGVFFITYSMLPGTRRSEKYSRGNIDAVIVVIVIKICRTVDNLRLKVPGGGASLLARICATVVLRKQFRREWRAAGRITTIQSAGHVEY